jgi:hypothetical protein
MPCQGCLVSLTAHERRTIQPEAMPKAVGDLEEGGVADAVCQRGHTTTYVINLPYFEIVFELACLSILEANYPHAVQGFTTALERFYEFYVCEIARRNGVPDYTYESARKQFKLAERQLGAFKACYLLQTKTAFDDGPIGAFTQLRNEVAHEGRIPTRAEAIKYGTVLLSEMHRVLDELFPRDPDGEVPLRSDSDYFRAFMKATDRAPKRSGATSLGPMPTMVDFAAPSTWGAGSFEARLKALARQRREFYVAPDDDLTD